MPRPKADAEKLRAALAAVQAGASQADAAQRNGVGLNTLKRALKASAPRSPAAPRSPVVRPPERFPAEADELDELDAPEGPPVSLVAEVDAALRDIGDDPEARIIGTTLRTLVEAIPTLDPSKLPQIATAVRTLARELREMRPPRPPSPDLVDERLRALDAPTLEEIERYTTDADKAFAQRLEALKAWGAQHLAPELAGEHAALVDALTSPSQVVAAPAA